MGRLGDRQTALQKPSRERLEQESLFPSLVGPWLGLFQGTRGMISTLVQLAFGKEECLDVSAA